MPPITPQQTPQHRWSELRPLLITSNEGAVDLGNMTLKSVMLINGGAAVAVLAFIANKWTLAGAQKLIVVEMIDVLSLLTTGVFVAALAAGFGYLRFYFEGMYHQFHIKDGNDHKTLLWTVNIMVLIAICLVVVAYVLFGVAMWSASDALLR